MKTRLFLKMDVDTSTWAGATGRSWEGVPSDILSRVNEWLLNLPAAPERLEIHAWNVDPHNSPRPRVQ